MSSLSWLPSATRVLSQNLSTNAWEPSNMSTKLPKQRQNHIHKLPNSSTSHSQETSAYNLAKLCYLITRCTWHFQARSPQHTQMLRAIHGLFSQQKRVHSLSTKGTNSFSRYKIQTIHILKVTNHSFHSKMKITCWDTVYVFLCTKYKLCLLTMIVQT